MAGRVFPFFERRAFSNGKAMSTQELVELHSKTGEQWRATFFSPSVAAGVTSDILFTTGAQTVFLRNVLLGFDSQLVSSQTFENPDTTGGTSLTPYSFNPGAGIVSGVTILAGVTVNSPGSPYGPKIYSLGSVDLPNTRSSALNQDPGIGLVLQPNTSYLLRTTNEDGTNDTRLSGLASWYEGTLSTEMP